MKQVGATRIYLEFVATTTPAAAVSNVTPTPCFGSIAGQVVADLNANRQIDSVDSGVMGATLFLKNANGIVVRGNTANANTAWGFHFYGVTSSVALVRQVCPRPLLASLRPVCCFESCVCISPPIIVNPEHN